MSLGYPDLKWSLVVTAEDLSEFFSFKTTSYLQKICKVELFVCPKTDNSRCFTYVTVPYHLYKEIIKLNGVVFKSKPVKIEHAKVRPKSWPKSKAMVTAIQNFWK